MHGHTRLELIWTVDPRRDPRDHRAASSSTSCPTITSAPRRCATRSTSRSRAISSTGSSTTRTARARSATLHVPVGARRRPRDHVARRDPQLVDPGARRQDPGDPRPHEPHLVPGRRRTATYDGQCAELCGVVPRLDARDGRLGDVSGDYQHYLTTLRRTTLGKQICSGVCATCHGNLGPGRLRPGDRDQPALKQTAGAAAIVRNGVTARGGCRPSATPGRRRRCRRSLAYVKTHIYKGRPERRVAVRAEAGLSRRLEERPRRELARHRRPQADRDPVHRDVARLLRRGRDPRAAHARAARDAEREAADEELVQRGA